MNQDAEQKNTAPSASGDLHHVLHRPRGQHRPQPADRLFARGVGRIRTRRKHCRKMELRNTPDDLRAEQHPHHRNPRMPANRTGRTARMRTRRTGFENRPACRAGRHRSIASRPGFPLDRRQRMDLCDGDGLPVVLPGDHRPDVHDYPLAAPLDPRGGRSTGATSGTCERSDCSRSPWSSSATSSIGS